MVHVILILGVLIFSMGLLASLILIVEKIYDTAGIHPVYLFMLIRAALTALALYILGEM